MLSDIQQSFVSSQHIYDTAILSNCLTCEVFCIQNTGDDVEIFAPAMKAAYTTEPATDSPSDPPPANQLPVEEDLQSHDKEVAKQLPVVQGLKSHDKEAANQMADSLEMVHDFGAGEDGEMPECDNEGFVPASDGEFVFKFAHPHALYPP